MRVLGIDTSCDETSIALVEDRKILAHVVQGQQSLHERFRGVVPEIAARAHVERLLPALDKVLSSGGGGPVARSAGYGPQGARGGRESLGSNLAGVEAVAVTNRPGLIGPLLVGLSAAKAFAFIHKLPLVAVHHLEAHAAAAYLLDPPPEPPFLALIASGGHTLLYDVEATGSYRRVGQTVDDAAGECFDKIAAMLGLPHPGGPSIERAATGGDPKALALPRPLRDDHGDDYSFSGLKTAVLYLLRSSKPSVADVAASAQEAIADVLTWKAIRAARRQGRTRLVLGGGVAANTRVRELAIERGRAAGIEVFVPPRPLCTDNAAMIAVRGAELLAAGVRDGLDIDADPYSE